MTRQDKAREYIIKTWENVGRWRRNWRSCVIQLVPNGKGDRRQTIKYDGDKTATGRIQRRQDEKMRIQRGQDKNECVRRGQKTVQPHVPSIQRQRSRVYHGSAACTTQKHKRSSRYDNQTQMQQHIRQRATRAVTCTMMSYKRSHMYNDELQAQPHVQHLCEDQPNHPGAP